MDKVKKLIEKITEGIQEKKGKKNCNSRSDWHRRHHM